MQVDGLVGCAILWLVALRTMSIYRDKVLEKLLAGKRLWSASESPGGDPDLFMVAVVEPLRQLCEEGVIDNPHEHQGSYRGRRLVDQVRITGDLRSPAGD